MDLETASAKDDVDTGQQQFQLGLRELSDLICEETPVDSHDLRHIGDGVFRQPCDACRETSIAWRFGPVKIACQWDTNHGADLASIEIIALNDNDRPAEAGSGSSWRSKISPPDFSLPDHHSDRSKTLRLAIRTKLSGWVLTCAQTRFIDSVTSSEPCRATYSANATANKLLRDLRSCRRSCSTFSNRSLGIETATFIPRV